MGFGKKKAPWIWRVFKVHHKLGVKNTGGKGAINFSRGGFGETNFQTAVCQQRREMCPVRELEGEN